jgi:hypothetical protein
MRISDCLIIVFVAPLVGCSAIPQLPPDTDFPVREIFLNASCELQDAFRFLNTRGDTRFKAGLWLVNITLQPRTDTEVSAGVGLSGVSGNHSFALGSGGGLGGNIRGARNSGVTYSMKSAELIASHSIPCDRQPPTFHALSQNLQVGQWLIRSASAMDLNPIASIDKPSFNSQITIKFSGDGTYSYAFPGITPTVSAGGSYSTDQQLLISLVPIDPPPVPYRLSTLPVSGLKASGSSRNAALLSEQLAQRRGDTIQLENTLRSLRILQ